MLPLFFSISDFYLFKRRILISDDDKPEISRVIRPFPPWKLESGLNISFNKTKDCSPVFAGKELITPFSFYSCPSFFTHDFIVVILTIIVIGVSAQ